MIYWLIFLAGSIRVASERRSSKVARRGLWMVRMSPKGRAFMDALFLILLFAAALGGDRTEVLGLSVATLIFLNAVTLIFLSLLSRRAVAGVWLAVCLYLPLSVWAHLRAYAAGGGWGILLVSSGLGLVWLAAPGLFWSLVEWNRRREGR